MRDLDFLPMSITPMSPEAIERVADLGAVQRALNPDATIPTRHVLHADLYARTICVPAGLSITGALIKIPTLLVVQGEAYVTVGDGVRYLSGYNVIPASAGRKQAFSAVSDTYITMVFSTGARTVEEAEREFTDDFASLLSGRPGAENETVTGGGE